MQLRPYQQACVNAAMAEVRQSIEPCLIDAAPAAGKSFMIAAIAAELHRISGGKRVLCLAPSAELVRQNHAKYLLAGERASIFSASAGAKSTRNVVVFGTPGTVKNAISRFCRHGREGFCAVVVDECFTGDTMVSTPRGDVSIKSLRNGDKVCNAMGIGDVVTTFTKSVLELYEVKLSNGKTIRCTGNHPFFTERGWISAACLVAGEVAFREQDVSDLHGGVWAKTNSNEKEGRHATQKEEPDARGELEQASDLLAILREEIEEPDALGSVSQKDARGTKRNRAQADDARGEWARPNRTPIGTVENSGRGLDIGAFGSNEGRSPEWDISEPLQDRHRQSRDDDSDRGGRRQSCGIGSTRSRSQENRIADALRVESVSRIELASPETVYNLHVSGHPSYYAGGVLVHNCHGITPTIQAIIEEMRRANPNLRVIGLSGTPYRLGSGYVFRIWPDGRVNGDDKARGPYFTRCVYRVSAREMLDGGFIAPMTIGAINSGDTYDTSGIHLLPNGMPNPDDIERAFVGHGRKTAVIVADVIARARGRHGGVMLFAATVRHAGEIMASLPPANARLVTGETAGKERARIIADYREQRFRYLVSVGTLTTGFDVEHTSTIALLRYTESAALLQQIMGRAWRIHPGKADSLLLDYAGNVERHFPDGDIYAPVFKASGLSGDGAKLEAECPDCRHVNEFTVHRDYADYETDRHGYCLDVFGELLQSDFGPVPGHYGRRCFGQLLQPGGTYERCGYRWNGKECPHCSEVNDIAARYCYVCKGEIIDPNEKLAAEFKALKRDPSRPQTDRVLEMNAKEGVSQKGNATLRVDWVTPYRQFSTWFQPNGTHPRARAELAAFRAATAEGKPETISYTKDLNSGFFRVLAYNQPEDVEPGRGGVSPEEVLAA